MRIEGKSMSSTLTGNTRERERERERDDNISKILGEASNPSNRYNDRGFRQGLDKM